MKHGLAFSAAILLTSCATVGFGRLDADDGDKLSRQEAAAAPDVAAFFDRFDEDQDGFLDRNEFEGATEFVRAAQQPAHDHGRSGGHGH